MNMCGCRISPSSFVGHNLSCCLKFASVLFTFCTVSTEPDMKGNKGSNKVFYCFDSGIRWVNYLFFYLLTYWLIEILHFFQSELLNV